MLNTTLGAFQYIHANYDMDKKLRTLFVNPKLTARLQRDGLAHLCTANIAPDSQAQGDVLSNTQRLVLLHSIIGARVFRGGAHLELGTFKKRGVILGYFCLHHSVSLDELEESWLFARPWDTPVDQIREYFGERIGLYFGFQSFVTTWVVFAAAVGVLAWIALAFNGNNPSAGDMPYYGGIMAVWATLMLEFWKQREARYAMQWGTSHFEKNEAERPGFDGVIVESPVNMEHEVHFPDGQKYSRVILSNVIVGCLLLLDLGVMAAIMYLRIYLNSLPSLQISGVQLGNFIASFINSFQIVVGNYLFQMVAKNLTEYENYRTDTEYEDALVYKSFSFIFINSYASLFYIAFAKSNIGSFDQCVNFDCMEELKSTLGMLFITNIVVVTLTRLGVPLAQQYVSKRSNFVGADGQPLVEDAIPEVERDFTLGDFDDLLGTFDKYSVDAVTYGYLTMFITAYPLASLMVLIQNFINIRVDAFCMCNLFRRPVARQAQDTGSWQKVYEFLGFAAVVVNSALVAFTGTYCIEYKPETRVWVFIGMCVLLMTAKYAAMSFVDDVPKEVVIQLKRQDFIISKVINEIPDDNSWKDKGAKKPVNEDPAHLVVDDFDKNPY
jgi:anoctamin-10/anoctamin-7